MQNKSSHPITPVFDAGPLLDAVRLQSEALTASLPQLVERYVDEQRAQLEEAVRQVTNKVALQEQVLTQFFTSLGKAVERTLSDAEIASQDIADPLMMAGFWVPPSAPISLIVQLSGLVSDGPPGAAAVRELIVDFYSANDASQLRGIVAGWTGHPSLTQLQAIIEDALEAHVAGKYTLSIPTLLPVVERLLTDLHGGYVPGGKMPKIARQQIESLYTDFMQEASKGAVVHYITGSGLYGKVPQRHFTVSAFPVWLASQGLTERDVVNRHAILHGVQTDYAGEENSLRVFLLIDVLSWVTREEWDEQLKTVLKER